MKYRTVGKSGVKVSQIALGSWLTYGDKVGKAESFQCIQTAIDQGINFIDSAEIYAHGKAEIMIGEFLKENVVKREDLVISSKVFWPMSENVNRWGLSRKNIMTAIEGTLKRLQTDYLDIYFMHRFDYTTPLEETASVIDDLIHQGKIRYWGTSAWTAAQLERMHAICKENGYHVPIVDQPMYNMLFRHIELEIMSVAISHGMGLFVFSPLAQGILTGKYNAGIPPGSRGGYSDDLKKVLTQENLQKVRQLTELAKHLGISIGQMALAWILRRSEISTVIIGATKPEHIQENVKASEITLSQSTFQEIDVILNNTPTWPPTYDPIIYHKDLMYKPP